MDSIIDQFLKEASNELARHGKDITPEYNKALYNAIIAVKELKTY